MSTTPLPPLKVPFRTPMYDRDGNMDRVWIKFFERNPGSVSSTEEGGTEGVRIYNWELGVTQDIAVGTTLTGKLKVEFPGDGFRWSITSNIAPTGRSIVADIKKNSSSIFLAGEANKIVLPAGSVGPIEGTSFAASPYPFVHLDILTIDILHVGSIVPGFKVHVQLVTIPRA